ncbi:aldehyde dehydrogenase family protein [Polymorphospora lycopeni]|uniref:Aldehyde dehydrogenase family protein n=1 Tax=Polymorphospora lycopeni TaxID=3140240 RepID=A0ABV5CVA2_9ACTN
MEKITHVIDGHLVPSANGETFVSIGRAPWARVALGGDADADAALAAARRAFDDGPWPELPQARRSAALHRLADLLDAHADELARRDTRDAGKPYAAVAGYEIGAAAQELRDHADLARLSAASTYPRDDGLHIYSRYPPAGVVVAVTPWNFPVPLAVSKIGPALAWGNTVVLKPAEQTPESATRIAELALTAGIPPGVLNVVHGYGPGGVGERLVGSPLADRVTFTGTSAAGAAVAAATGTRLPPVQMECGGEAANIIFADADLDRAAELSVRGAFGNSRQICVAATRLYLQREVFDTVHTAVVAGARELRLGDPMDPRTALGPLVSREQHEQVLGYLETVAVDGGEIVTGGAGPDGWFVRPTVAVGLAPDARAHREEIFGPVVVAAPFDTEDEAVALANDSVYGLSASLFTGDTGRAHRVAARLHAGIVWVNTFGVRDWRAPFGGYRRSGVGREGGEFSRAFLTEPTSVVMGG